LEIYCNDHSSHDVISAFFFSHRLLVSVLKWLRQERCDFCHSTTLKSFKHCLQSSIYDQKMQL